MNQLRLYRPEALARAEEELLHLIQTKALVATAKTAKQLRNQALTKVATDVATATTTTNNPTNPSSSSLHTFSFNFME